jgi:hydrogenase maturation factor
MIYSERGEYRTVCVTRVGEVREVSRGRARVKFFDGRALEGVDVTMAGAAKGDYVEVFGNLALSVLTKSEARTRRRAWSEVMKGALLAEAEAGLG